MSDRMIDRLLGTDAADIGCDGAFEELDAYCEAVRAGEDVGVRFPAVAAHMVNCAACREDAAGLIAMLEAGHRAEGQG